MRLFTYVGAMVLLAAALLFTTVTNMAFAQDTTVNIGELISPWLELLVGAFAVLVTAILGWIAAQIKEKTGIDIEARHREALQTALTNAAGVILAKLASRAADVTIDVRHPAIATGIKYVAAAVPDAISEFGLTQEQIADKIVAKLGLALAPNKLQTHDIAK